MTDETTHLRALLAEQTARAERAEADYRRVLSERAEANQLAGRCAQQRDQALAACAEMRAAGLVAHDHACKMAEFHGPRCEEHERHDEAPDDCLRCAADTAFGLAFAELRKALSRPDLGAGMVVVPREVVERLREAAMGEIMISPKALADLDALLDGGKGRG